MASSVLEDVHWAGCDAAAAAAAAAAPAGYTGVGRP